MKAWLSMLTWPLLFCGCAERSDNRNEWRHTPGADYVEADWDNIHDDSDAAKKLPGFRHIRYLRRFNIGVGVRTVVGGVELHSPLAMASLSTPTPNGGFVPPFGIQLLYYISA